MVAIQLQELLSMAGVDLNEHHPNSGGEEPTGNLKWPLWRMTGVSIMLGTKACQLPRALLRS